ncbi:MAG: chemoreceptor glutamine deamidase CheD [Gammaproteobacteria bacterium]|nr:chemoreceptor glutamine deamidase CheD [Gammaproteobacteria bacterium]
MQKLNKSDFPCALPGFEGINRYWDYRMQSISAKILPGEYYVTASNEVVTTVLGSCVSACIRERDTGVGGMNHFLLPLNKGESWSSRELASLANRYGNYAMENMINDILKQGGRKKNLEVKIFGGSRIIDSMTDIGKSNVRFVRNYLTTEELTVLSEDVGGTNPRKIMFFPGSGKVLVKKIKELHNDTIIRREVEYIDSIERDKAHGDVDFFD